MSMSKVSERFPLRQMKKLSLPFTQQNGGAEYVIPEAGWAKGSK